jgi:hypothetical protein
MRLEERSYSGKTFRPKPLLVSAEGGSALFVLSSWGHRDDAQQVAEIFSEQAQIGDTQDLTTPFGYIESLGPMANRLRTAAHLANDLLFRSSNQAEYVSGLEVLALAYKDNILSWMQVGGPHLLLIQDGVTQPLASQFDWSWQLNQSAPLPCQCLGLQRSLHIHCGSAVLLPGAEIFMIARGAVPSAVYAGAKTDLPSMSKILVEDNSEAPFWLGHIKL